MKLATSIIAASLSWALVSATFGAVTITSSSFTYSQNFNTLASTGASNAWVNNSTISGWYLFGYNQTSTPSTYGTSNAAGTTAGSFYSYGSSAADRALGGTASGNTYFGSPAPVSGAIAGYLAVAFTNNLTDPISSITFGFDGEQWRNGGNASAQSMVLEYGFGTTMVGVSTWTAPGGNFVWSSPVTGASAAAVDGNVAGLVANRGGTLNSLNWAAGETLWIRWIERNDAGNDHGLAIDNFSVTAIEVDAIPEPSRALLFGLGSLGLLLRRRRA